MDKSHTDTTNATRIADARAITAALTWPTERSTSSFT